MRWIPLSAVVAIVAAVVGGMLLLPLLLGVEFSLFAAVGMLLQLGLVLAFLALATWVVANVWKSVMRR